MSLEKACGPDQTYLVVSRTVPPMIVRLSQGGALASSLAADGTSTGTGSWRDGVSGLNLTMAGLSGTLAQGQLHAVADTPFLGLPLDPVESLRDLRARLQEPAGVWLFGLDGRGGPHALWHLLPGHRVECFTVSGTDLIRQDDAEWRADVRQIQMWFDDSRYSMGGVDCGDPAAPHGWLDIRRVGGAAANAMPTPGHEAATSIPFYVLATVSEQALPARRPAPVQAPEERPRGITVKDLLKKQREASGQSGRARNGSQAAKQGASVFVSYSHADLPYAYDLERGLAGHGIRCWIGPRDVRPSADYAAEIVNALDAARAFVLVYSAATVTSTHCVREVELALKRGLPIYTVKIDGSPIAAGYEYRLATVQWIEGPSEVATSRLASALALLG